MSDNMTAYVFKRKRPPVLQYTGDYTKVGSPTIENNVVSGFSASNYLITKSVFNPLDADFEFVFKINLTSHAVNVILAENRTGQFSKVYLCVNSDKKVFFGIGTGSAWRMRIYGNTELALNTDYWIKAVKSNGTFYLYYSLDGKDYILDNSVANTSVFPTISVEGRIGCWKDSQSGNSYFHGSIDLTESYIKVDGEYWWRGAKYVNADKAYVLKRKRPTEYRKTVIDTATAGTYTFDVAKDRTAKIILVGGGGGGGYVWEGHADGSGGGSGACVYIKAKLTAGTYTITNGAGGAAGNVSVGGRAGGDSTLSLKGETLITAGGGGGGAGAGGAAGVGGTYLISNSVEVERTSIVSNGNTGSRGGNMVTGKGGASVYGGYGKGANSRTSGTSGYIFVELTTDETDYDYKIDNDACYVLRRKHYWKYGTEPNSNLIVTGSISFENGIARGFSNTNYLSFNIGTTQKTDLVEIDIAFNTGTWSVVSEKACGILGGDSFPEIQLYNGRSNVGGGDYIGSYVYSTNQDVEWKVQIQNGVLTILKLNPDTNEYEVEGSVNDSTVVSGIINIGRNKSTRYLKDGFVDITKLKVYKNGTLFKRFTKDVKATKDDYDFITD